MREARGDCINVPIQLRHTAGTSVANYFIRLAARESFPLGVRAATPSDCALYSPLVGCTGIASRSFTSQLENGEYNNVSRE